MAEALALTLEGFSLFEVWAGEEVLDDGPEEPSDYELLPWLAFCVFRVGVLVDRLGPLDFFLS